MRGYEVEKGSYFQVTEDELEALEAEANSNIELKEFNPWLWPRWLRHDKETLVLIRPGKGGLMLQMMYYGNEIRISIRLPKAKILGLRAKRSSSVVG